MRADILTTFPEMLEAPLDCSLVGRAREAEFLDVRIHNLRDYTRDKHRSTDDLQYGGGDGMVMNALPIVEAVEALSSEGPPPRVIFPSPQGRVFNQSIAESYANEERLLFVCGHYKGIDDRAIQILQGEELSIGDYVLSGGELAALVVVDAVARLLPGVVGSMNSVLEDSFTCGLLDSPRYTRPREVRGLEVPEPLLSGNHRAIEEWRLQESIKRTKERRPDLYEAWVKSHRTNNE